ncbi:MAG: Ferredoxin, partial [Labilithrix sp.]|nr:Ferredoxin [Labilithrix sp.]
MAAAPSPSPRSGAPAHAGIALDLTSIERQAHDHAPVEPIPWKTGDVGVVAPLDVDTSWQPKTDGLKVRSAAKPPAEKAGCGSSCGCKSAEAPKAPAKDAAAMKRATASRMSELASILGIGTPRESSKLAPDGDAPAKGAAPPKKKKVDPKLPGSGIPARRSIRILLWVRRAAQVGFFALFMFFLFQTGFRGTFNASSDTPVRLPYPVEAFLLADPFVTAMTLGATHQVYRGLLWSVGLLAITLVFGRVFCGWICPFGTLHHFFAWILPSRKGRGAARVEANKTHGYQRAKYYLMYAFLLASLVGSAIGGLFDPICIAVRAIGLGVIPGVQYMAHRALGAAQD